jgi:hypothetical protein
MKGGFVAVVLVALVSVCSADVGAVDRGAMKSDGENIASKIVEAHRAQQRIERTTAPVHNKAQLAEFLASSKATNSPLKYLSPEARDRFVGSLKINDQVGLRSFYYVDIEKELSASQAYELLSIFGGQGALETLSGLRGESPADKAVLLAYGSKSPALRVYDEDTICNGDGTCSHMRGYVCVGKG